MLWMDIYKYRDKFFFVGLYLTGATSKYWYFGLGRSKGDQNYTANKKGTMRIHAWSGYLRRTRQKRLKQKLDLMSP